MLALSIKDLKKTYENGNVALKGINFSVEPGDFYALLGPNGAGKTTAIGIMSSLVNKTSGDVEIFGHSIDTDLAAAKACIGLVVSYRLQQIDVSNGVRHQSSHRVIKGMCDE